MTVVYHRASQNAVGFNLTISASATTVINETGAEVSTVLSVLHMIEGCLCHRLTVSVILALFDGNENETAVQVVSFPGFSSLWNENETTVQEVLSLTHHQAKFNM